MHSGEELSGNPDGTGSSDASEMELAANGIVFNGQDVRGKFGGRRQNVTCALEVLPQDQKIDIGAAVSNLRKGRPRISRRVGGDLSEAQFIAASARPAQTMHLLNL